MDEPITSTPSPLERGVRFLPWIGAALIVAGFVVTVVTRRFELLNNLLLGAGALAILLYAILRPDDVRELVSGRYARYGTSTLLSVLFFGAICVLLYWLAYQNDDWRLDLTETGEFTPPPETVELLEGLDEPIHVIGFYTAALAAQREEARSILDSLTAYSDNLSYEFQDPEVNPLLAEQYELNFNGTLVFIRNRGQTGEIFARANSLSDRDVHAALLEVVNPREKRLYLITGHGEPGSDDFGPEGMGTMVSLLEDQGFTVESLNLFTAGEVPQEAAVVALIGPQTPLDPAEVEALTEYVEGGGALFIARDVVDSEGRAAAEDDGLNDYLAADWAITLRNDVIVDQDLARAGQQFGLDFLAAEYGNHPIISEEIRDLGARFSLARSIVLEETEDGSERTELVRTSPSAWGETDFAQLTQAGIAEPGPEDAEGTLSIGVSAQRPDGETRLVVFGDADFVNNSNLVWGGNSLLFANSLNWLAGDEVAIELAPRESVERQLNIADEQLRLLRIIVIWLGPLLMGMVGVLVWSSRRQRQ